MTDLLFIGLAAAIGLGPSIRWFMINKPTDPSVSQNRVKSDASGVLLWTTFALALFMCWSWARGEKVRDVCKSFQEQISGGIVSEGQWARIVDGRWWDICHPDNSIAEDS
jgi:hypothetical protein